jgi:nucleotide-binding universal stress UspA family protein
VTGPVVAGVDGGAAGADALVLGSWLADRLKVPLIVAAVHPAPAALGSGRVDAEWVADRRRAADQVLASARSALAGSASQTSASQISASQTSGSQISGSQTSGSQTSGGEIEGGEVEFRTVPSSSAAHGLSDLAEETGASLIAVGSARNAPPERLFAGSTAERLMSGSPCPVAIAPAGLTGPLGTLDRIAVAYVDTPDGRAALTGAAALARPSGSRLRLITVVAEGNPAMPFMLGDDAERAFLDTARETYEQSLAKAVQAVPDVTAEWEIRSGDAVDVLAELDDADVLYCGSRGYGPARRVFLGGVSTRLARRARRPLIVVPRSG